MSASEIPSNNLLLFSLRYRWYARVGILALAFVGALMGVASPFFQKVFIDGVLGQSSLEAARLGLSWIAEVPPLAAITIAFFCTLSAQAIGLVGNYWGVKEGALLQTQISEHLYRKTLMIRPATMGSTTVGEVVANYATDVPGGAAIIDQVLPMASIIAFNVVCAPIAVYWICGIPIWATCLVMALVICMNVFMGYRQSRFFSLYKQLAAERTGIVNEWIQTIRLLRILGWIENFENKIFRKREAETRNRVAMVTNGQVMNSFGSSINFIVNLTGVASLIFLSGKKVTPGQLFAMLWIFGVFLSRSFRQIPWFFTFSLDATTSMRRLEAFLARPSDAGDVDSGGAEETDAAKALALSVRGLNLELGGHRILKDIDFDVAAGEFVAIVGEVGSGKSLLALSLVGETGASFSRFSLGAADALQMDLNERRRHFAFVQQEGFVMSASLRENVAFLYEVDESQDASIENSMRVSQFPLREIQGPGLETEIGERGVNLSGGQRQRVSLARAHHFERPIILLDDCLSAVDVDTEKSLLKDLIDGVWRGRTRLLVTHRLSVLDRVDRILFVEDGRIVETGSFKELLAKSRRVQEFVASVLRGEEEEKRNALGRADAASE